MHACAVPRKIEPGSQSLPSGGNTISLMGLSLLGLIGVKRFKAKS
jgi:hypothetical protein